MHNITTILGRVGFGDGDGALGGGLGTEMGIGGGDWGLGAWLSRGDAVSGNK